MKGKLILFAVATATIINAQVIQVDDFTQGPVTVSGQSVITTGDTSSIIGGKRLIGWNSIYSRNSSASITGDGVLRIADLIPKRSFKLAYGATNPQAEFTESEIADHLHLDLTGMAFRLTVKSMTTDFLPLYLSVSSFTDNGGETRYRAFAQRIVVSGPGTILVPIDPPPTARVDLTDIAGFQMNFLNRAEPGDYEFTDFAFVPIPEPEEWILIGGCVLLAFGMLRKMIRSSAD